MKKNFLLDDIANKIRTVQDVRRAIIFVRLMH